MILSFSIDAGKLNAIGRGRAANSIVLIACAMLGFLAHRAAAQDLNSASSAGARIVGNWAGNTEDDGVVSVTLTADGFLAFQFSGGERDHGFGAYRLGDRGVLLYTPHGESDAEHWTYGLDRFGRLKLKMEEDNPKDVEEYTLVRVRP